MVCQISYIVGNRVSLLCRCWWCHQPYHCTVFVCVSVCVCVCMCAVVHEQVYMTIPKEKERDGGREGGI